MVLTVELNNIVTVSPSKTMKTLLISIEGSPYVYDIPYSKKAEIDSSSAYVCPFFYSHTNMVALINTASLLNLLNSVSPSFESVIGFRLFADIMQV